MKIIKIFIYIILLLITTVKYCYANPSFSLLPMFPDLKIWALLIIVIIECAIFKMKYKNMNSVKLFSSIAYANLVSSIIGVIIFIIVYISLDFSSSDKALRDFNTILLSAPFFSTNRSFFAVYFLAIIWTSIALLLTYFLGVYIESRMLIYNKAIGDTAENIIKTTYYANLYSYIFVATILFYDLYFKSQKLLDGSLY